MLYLLDSDVLVRAHEDYYPIDRVPHFWEWLIDQGANGRVKLPFEMHDEITSVPKKGYSLYDWLMTDEVRAALVLDEEVDGRIVNRVLAQAYAVDLNDTELEQIGRDPFLIAYALMGGGERTVVTKEVSKVTQVRGKRKIPDACAILNCPVMNDFQFYRAADFRITR